MKLHDSSMNHLKSKYGWIKTISKLFFIPKKILYPGQVFFQFQNNFEVYKFTIGDTRFFHSFDKE